MLLVTLISGVKGVIVTDAIPADTAPTGAVRAIIEFSEFRQSTPTYHGGFVRTEYGTITLTPSLFADPGLGWWPPPTIIEQISVNYTPPETGVPFDIPQTFVGYLAEINSKGVTYSLWPSDEFAETATEEFYSGTLNTVFTAACSTLGLSLNATYARSPSPTVKWQTSGEHSLLDNLNDIAKSLCHRFYISGTTLYLVDCFLDNGSTITVANNEVIEVSYPSIGPYKQFCAEYNIIKPTRIQLEILALQGGGSSCILCEVDIAKAVGASLMAPDAIYANWFDPSYPYTNLVDSNTATFWVSGGGAGTNLALQMAVTSGQIKEYALQARASGSLYPPSEWRLSITDEDMYADAATPVVVGIVEADGWTALEQRRFTVPEATMMITRDKYYSTTHNLGEVYQISPICQTDYNLIKNSLANIDTTVSRARTRVKIPIRHILPGQRVEIADASICENVSITAWLRADSITYNFTDHYMVVEGGGGRS